MVHRQLLRGLLTSFSVAGIVAIAAIATRGAIATAEPAAPATEPAARAVDPAIELVDVASGRRAALRTLAGGKATLVFFASNECPVALAYEQDLAAQWKPLRDRGVALVAVTTSHESRAAIDQHRSGARLPYPVYQDPGGRLAAALDATRTSEVALLAPGGRVVYQGRIDDRVTPSVRRPHATTHELADAIDAVLADRAIAAPRTQAAGCVIASPRAPHAATPGEHAPSYADIAPILGRYCVGCHRPGEAGPMSLVSYEQAAEWADTIADVLHENRMPPSRLSPPDPHFGEFVAAPEPSAAEIARIAAWVDAGAPRGPGAARTAAPIASSGWAIGKPDLILTMPRAYSIPASGVVEYQYYNLLTYTGDERWIEAIEIRPSARSVVHHANVYMAQAELGTVGFDAGERWASFAPGRPPTTFPDGVARRLPHGAKLTLEIHYTTDGVPRDDRTVIGLRFARTPPRREARGIPLGTLNFEIPPRAPAHEVTATYTLKGNGQIASFTPHMHDRGKDFRYEAILPDGTTQTLLFVPTYNFKWQFVYVPKKMIVLPKGTVLRATAHYDNSTANPRNPDPGKTVRFGLQTFEEMMFGFVEVVYDEDIGSQNLRALRAADLQSLPNDRGFSSWAEFGTWARQFQERRASR